MNLETAKHSPLPWSSLDRFNLVSASGEAVARVHFCGDERTKENLAYIEAACNSAPATAALLRDALAILGDFVGNIDARNLRWRALAALKRAAEAGIREGG